MSVLAITARNKILIGLLSTVFLLLGFLAGSLSVSQRVAGSKRDAFLSIREYEDIQSRALKGSVQDSTAMIQRLSDCASGLKPIVNWNAEKCAEAITFWSDIDAQNGGTLGASLIFNRYSDSNICHLVRRADFWARKIGGANMKSRISEVERKEQNLCSK